MLVLKAVEWVSSVNLFVLSFPLLVCLVVTIQAVQVYVDFTSSLHTLLDLGLASLLSKPLPLFIVNNVLEFVCLAYSVRNDLNL